MDTIKSNNESPANLATLRALKTSIKKLEMCKDSFSELIECLKTQFQEVETRAITKFPEMVE